MNNVAAHLQTTAAKTLELGAAHLGDLVGWNAQGVHIRRSDLREVLARYGFGQLVRELDPGVALTTGAARGRCKDFVVRPFQRPNKDTPVALGVYREVVVEGESGSTIICGARIRVSAAGTIVALPPEGQQDADEACFAHAVQLAANGNDLLEHVQTSDLGSILVALLTGKGGLAAVSIKDAGGVYFVPVRHSGTWRALSRDIAELSGASLRDVAGSVAIWAGGSFRPITIEVPDTPESARAVATSTHDTLADQLSSLRDDLAKFAEVGGVTKRSTLTSRLGECESIMDRARLYRGVLHGFVEQLDAQVAVVRASFEQALTDYDKGQRAVSVAKFAKE